MNTLVSHAQTELILMHEDPMTISGYLDVVQAYSDMGDWSNEGMLEVLVKLLRWHNLTALTDSPNEWLPMPMSTGQDSMLWQSTRCIEAFSTDGGATYYLLSERDQDPSSFHISEKVAPIG
jgi:hypothetical protein